MRRIAIFVAIVMFLGTSASVSNFNPVFHEKENAITYNEGFSQPEIADAGEYAIIKMDNANYLHDAGYPMMPFVTRTYYFPLGTRINVDIEVKENGMLKIDKKILPSPPFQPAGGERMETKATYTKDEFYPLQWYDYYMGGGIYDGEHVTILTIHLYPYRYNPARDEIISAEFDIKIDYTPPSKQMANGDYDLLIIAPADFENALQPLIQHKENHGIKTIFMSVEDIYSSYDGRDGAEKVKYAIKDAIEQHGIKYVMLVGGKKSYITGNWGYDGPKKSNDELWWVPVRYAALDDGTEGGYLSDLYYADIYDANGSFSSWDTNNNGIYAEWRLGGRDRGIDFYPDVYVGRLACRSVKEVETVVDKIIEYEENGGQEWFKRMLIIGGDTFDDREEKCEGEISTLWFYERHMQPLGFEKTSLFVSDGTLPFNGMENKVGGRFAWINVINSMNDGYGFVCMDGHGSPTAWATHFKGHASHTDPWVNGLMTYNMDLMHNKGMYPVVVIGGCHNSEFNISLLDFQKNEWTYQPTYECFGWHFIKMQGKGAIATLGNTGLGYGDTGEDKNDNGIPDCVEFSGGYIEDRFFNAYAEGKNILGETWGKAITDYINTYSPHKHRIDCKTIEEWVLLGDPTLMIGGYS